VCGAGLNEPFQHDPDLEESSELMVARDALSQAHSYSSAGPLLEFRHPVDDTVRVGARPQDGTSSASLAGTADNAAIR